MSYLWSRDMMTTHCMVVLVVHNLGCSEVFDHFNLVFIGICGQWPGTASIFFPSLAQTQFEGTGQFW